MAVLKGGINFMLLQLTQDPSHALDYIPGLISAIITLIIAFTIHEFSHAKVADLYGDETPRNAGRLTLNPLAHLDPIGSLMVLLFWFGWAKPVPVNPYQLRRRSNTALMFVSLAGPASNFVMALLASIPIRIGLVSHMQSIQQAASQSLLTTIFPTPYEFLLDFIFINVMLAFFNLIPLAPLDGEKIAEYFFPPPLAKVLDTIRPYGMLILVLLMFVLPMLGFNFFSDLIYTPIQNLVSLLIS
jgi:Zn-dependent protease